MKCRRFAFLFIGFLIGVISLFILWVGYELKWNLYVKPQLIKKLHKTGKIDLKIESDSNNIHLQYSLKHKDLIIRSPIPLSYEKDDRIIGEGIVIAFSKNFPELSPEIYFSITVLPFVIDETKINKAKSLKERKLLEKAMNMRSLLIPKIEANGKLTNAVNEVILIDGNDSLIFLVGSMCKVIQGDIFSKDMSRRYSYMILLNGVAPSVAWEIAKNIRFIDTQDDIKLEK